MKRIMIFALTSLMTMAAGAQNVQLHYDFGRNMYADEEAGRQKVTVTVEQFKADDWGRGTISWIWTCHESSSAARTQKSHVN